MQLEQSLQSHIAEAACFQSAAAQTTTASQAELHRLEQQAKALQQDLVAARTRTDEERAQTKQLASALTAACEEYQVSISIDRGDVDTARVLQTLLAHEEGQIRPQMGLGSF